MENTTVVRNGKAITVAVEAERSSVYTQPINRATGKPWQAKRFIAQFVGPNHKIKAFGAWMKAANTAK